MAKAILIIGESGSGKTTAMRNLPPHETFYIDCDGKGLSWRGWREQYNNENKNYLKSSRPAQVIGTLQLINGSEKLAHVKYVVVDTLNAIMIADEFARMKEKGYDKWQDLAASVYALIEQANAMRDDLTVIFIGHSQTERDESGFQFTRMRTSGRKLEKIVLESKFSTVLLAANIEGAYKFLIKAPNCTCKVPLGAIEAAEIDNDITTVIEALKDY